MKTQGEPQIMHVMWRWLLASALVTTMPHFAHQPVWLSLFSGLLMALAGWRCARGDKLLKGWLLVGIVVCASLAVLLEFRTLFGRDAGVALLVIFMAMKLLEIKNQRDCVVLISLGYFLLLTHYLYSQSMLTGLWLLFALWIVTASLVRLHGSVRSTVQDTLRQAGRMTLQSLPLMLVLFMLFPRVSGPLWGLPQDAHAGRSGLSESMSPGSISNLVRNGDIAFRVRFAGDIPPKNKLYWRGPVLEFFDGVTWQPSREKYGTEQIEALSPPIRYEVTLEAHNRRWLLALDAPVQLAPTFNLNGRLTAATPSPINERQRHTFSAALDFLFNVHESPAVLQHNLKLPATYNPKTLALAVRWKSENSHPAALINKALQHFSSHGFVYTLSPPLLGKDAVDEFLFNSQRGFCEHYAAAFVTLMRAAGVPARVVTGYQGGEKNPVDDYLVIRQSDAHAWAEVWIDEQGWRRVDPTAVVSPERIESGLSASIPGGEALPAVIQVRQDWLHALRFRWEALNNAWNQHVLGYDSRHQRELLGRLGLAEADWKTLAILLGLTGTGLVLVLAYSLLYQRPTRDPARALWEKALRRLARRRVNCAPWETPSALINRLRAEHPDLAEAYAPVVLAYLNTRYGNQTDYLKKLQRAVAQLP